MKALEIFFPVIINRFVCHVCVCVCVCVCVLQHTAATGSLVTFYANLHRPQAPFPLVSGCLPSRASCRGINTHQRFQHAENCDGCAWCTLCASSSSSIKWTQLIRSLKNSRWLHCHFEGSDARRKKTTKKWGCASGEVMFLVFTHIPGERYHGWLGSLWLCDVFQVLINSLVCLFSKQRSPFCN